MIAALPPGVEALDATCSLVVGALAHQSLYAAVAFALALPVAALLRRSPARVQATLWALVLLRLALPPGLAAPWSVRSLLAEVPVGEEAAGAPFAPLLGPAGPVTSGPGATAGGSSAGVPWSLLLVAAWLSGLAATATRLHRRRRVYETLARRAAPVGDPEAVGRFEALARRMGVRRPVRFRAGEEEAPPFALGVARPTVYVPASFLDPGRRPALDAALAHELAHVRAHDDLWLRLSAIVQALFFFHPVAWWAAARHADARELAADERVLASGALSSRAYGRGFTAAVRLASRTPYPAVGAPALAATRRRLVMRLERILDPRTSGSRRSGPTLLALLAGALLVLPMAGAAPAAPAEAPPAASPAAESAPMLAPPVPGARLTSAFGERWNPVKKHRDRHQGVDLAASPGTSVLAPAAGVVRVATESYQVAPNLGTVVILDHGAGLETLYAHLEALAVAPGQRVAEGDVLGTVGSTGDVTGPHLHFEVHDHGETVDPGKYLELPAR